MGKFIYEFALQDAETYTYEVDPDSDSQSEPGSDPSQTFWTRLDYHQCKNCPLSPKSTPHCPVAIDINQVANRFNNIISFTRIDVWVHAENRSYFKNCDAMTAVMSLFGLIMASGRCPILSKLKPLAHYHLPFSTLEETIHRVAGAYLIKQYFVYRDNLGKPDFKLHKLDKLYKELEIVNTALMDRLRAAFDEDTSLNAIGIFNSRSGIINMALDEMLHQIKPSVIQGFNNL